MAMPLVQHATSKHQQQQVIELTGKHMSSHTAQWPTHTQQKPTPGTPRVTALSRAGQPNLPCNASSNRVICTLQQSSHPEAQREAL